MKTNFELNMERVFDLPANTTPIGSVPDVRIEQKQLTVQKEPQANTALDQDFDYVRKNAKEIIDKARGAIDGLVILASTADSARAYEVLADLIRTTFDANKGLLDVHDKMRQLNIEDGGKPPSNITNNAVFVGSTSELQQLIKDQRPIIDVTSN